MQLLQAKNLAPLTDTKIKSCATALQKAIDRLGTVAKEIADGNIVLYAKEGGSHADSAAADAGPKADSTETSPRAGLQLMDLDQAIAAGLIPPHFLGKE